MPNTKEEWNTKVERAVETLGEAVAMGTVPPEQVISMVQAKAQQFEGNVPKFGDMPQGPGMGAPQPGGPPPGGAMPPGPGGPPPGGGMPPGPGVDMERMPPEDFDRMREDVLQGKLRAGAPERPPRR